MRLASRVFIIIICGLLLCGTLVYALSQGSQDIPFDQVVKAIRDQSSVDRATQLVIHKVRLPRVLVAGLVGLNLAVAGVMLQGVLRSPLADPYILGISAGSAFAAVTCILVIDSFPANAVPIATFSGALIGALIVYAIAWDGTGVSTTRLALAGVALTTMIWGYTVTVVLSSVQAAGAQIVLRQWLIGDLYSAGWKDYYLIAPYTLGGLIAAMLLANRANVLALGDEVAQGLGLRVEQTRFLMSLVAAVMAGSAVTAAGLIAFVGLLVPAVARRLVGSDYRYLIPTSAILGAALLIFADTVARVSLAEWFNAGDQQYPVGIITAIVGGPLFLWLVRARRSQW
jgi:iron complex transport system permease protein